VSIIVDDPNSDDQPLALDDAMSMDANTTLQGFLQDNDTPSSDGGNIWSKVSDPSHGSVTINPDGSFEYIPNGDFNGSDIFRYKIIDRDGDISQATVTIEVRAILQGYSIGNYIWLDSNKNGIQDDDEVPYGDADITISLHKRDSGVEIARTQVDANGQYQFDNVPNGKYFVQFHVDEHHLISENSDAFWGEYPHYAHLDLDQYMALEAKILTALKYQSEINEGFLEELLLDQDLESLDLSNIEFMPYELSFVDEDIMIYRAKRVTRANGANNSAKDSNPNSKGLAFASVKDDHNMSIDMGVNPVSSRPVAQDDTQSTPKDTAVSILVLGNDYDPMGGDVEISALRMPSNGSVSWSRDGSVIYTPHAGFVGVDRFEYTIIDQNGVSDSAMVTISIIDTLIDTNSSSENKGDVLIDNSVTALSDSANTAHNTAVSIPVLNNDYDSQNDDFSISDFNASTANGGIIVQIGNQLLYTPKANYSGTDIFSYEITDSKGAKSSASVKVTVLAQGADGVPNALGDGVSTYKDQAVDIKVMQNDTHTSGDSISVESTTNPANGTLVVNSDGSITYTPKSGFVGEDRFMYTIIDSNGDRATATVRVIIADMIPPQANDDHLKLQPNMSVGVIDVVDNDHGGTFALDRNSIELTLEGLPKGSTLNDEATVLSVPNEGVWTLDKTSAKISFTPNDDSYQDPTPLEYQIRDTYGNIVTASVSFDYPPVAIADVAEGRRDEVVSIDVLANDITTERFDITTLRLIDEEGNAVEFIDNPNEGTWIVENGRIVFTPITGFKGQTTPVGYTVKEEDGDPVTSTTLIYLSYPEVKDDNKTDPNAIAGQDSIRVDIFDNDPIVDPNLATLQIKGTSNAGESLFVEGEGRWSIVGDTIIFTPLPTFLGDPTSVEYKVANFDGEYTNYAKVSVFYPLQTRDDNASTPAGRSISIDIFENDNGNIDTSKTQLGIPQDFPIPNTTISTDKKKISVPDEGVWELDENGLVTFTPAKECKEAPTPITYTAFTPDGNQSSTSSISIEISDECAYCGQVDSASSFTVFSILFAFFATFGVLYFMREEEHL